MSDLNNKKVVFFDIDGTLFLPKVGIPKSTIEALKKLKENDISIVICTGRARALVPKYIIDLGFDGIIAGAGTYVEINGTKIHEENLDPLLATELISDIKKSGLIPILEGHSVSYYDDTIQDESYKKVLDAYFKEAEPYFIPIPKDYSNITIAKASARYTDNGDESFLIDKYKERFNIVSHSKLLLEFIPNHSSKAKGIEEYLKATNIQKSNTYAFGDSMNDFEMLNYVEYGVAMGNASEEFKSHFKYITERIDEDGIYNALNRFELL